MRVIILGVSGLIGHSLFKEISSKFETYGILHNNKSFYSNHVLFETENVFDNIDVLDFEVLSKVLLAVDPDVIINCVGITKRKEEIKNTGLTLYVNALFPHKLAEWSKANNKRIIHFSSDCVFDGKVGNYSEESLTTAEDMYGRTKALGEINYNHTLTLRSSFIGRELFSKTELLEWFLSQNGLTIRGFTKALYTGVSTIFLSKIVADIIESHPNLSGLKQLSIEKPISKYELLCLAREAFKCNIEIIPDDTFEIKPTLKGEKLRDELGYVVPTWENMMYDLAKDSFNYEKSRL
jgi:dTDP-4-dehydrorhamnose reductase